MIDDLQTKIDNYMRKYYKIPPEDVGQYSDSTDYAVLADFFVNELFSAAERIGETYEIYKELRVIEQLKGGND